MAVPYTFGTATSSIPLSQLDSNFSTAITLGNTAIQLGNTATTLNNMTLANVTIASGNVTLTNVTVTTANVTTANITTAVIVTGTVTNLTATSANVTTANITTGIITTANVTTANVTTLVVTGVSTLTGAVTAQGLTVGKGASAVATNSAFGVSALAAVTSGSALTAIGYQAGNLATGIGNQFFGYSSGSAVTTGAKNVILGSYTGSAAPISATGSNFVVLSDGDGNVRQVIDSNGRVSINQLSSIFGAQFEVTGTSGGQAVGIHGRASDGLANIVFGANGAGTEYARIQADNTSSLQFGAGSTGAEKMRLDSSGNLGIGVTANASAILDAQSTTKGVRMPNMTTTQKNAIASPAAGLMVFDTTLAKLCVYSGSAWQTITSI
jgi:hypothetical protein